ncbi:MAG: DUF503 domain-containing protein [Proteobacteria bacterium]|nr:DUF503 domain-containing protein [Pseudomonadota bacterium]
MVVGVCKVVLIIHESRSLKDKRRVVKSLLKRVRNTFNVSASEVGEQELLQKAEIAIVTVANDGPFVNSVVDKVLNFIEELQLAEVVDESVEIIRL